MNGWHIMDGVAAPKEPVGVAGDRFKDHGVVGANTGQDSMESIHTAGNPEI